MLMARILVVAVFLLTTSAFGQSSPGGTPGEFPEQLNLDAFWEQAFELDYVEGASAIVLGDKLADGSIEVWVLDSNNLGDPEDLLLQPGGHLNPHIEHQLDWIEPVDATLIDGAYAASVQAQLRSVGGTLVGTTGTVFHVSGLASLLTADFTSPFIESTEILVFTPTSLHRNEVQALDAATDIYLDVIPDDLSDLPNFVPGDPGPQEPTCAQQCSNTLVANAQIAFNNWENARTDCRSSWQAVVGGGLGCSISAVLCFPFGGPPASAACCLAGGAAAAAWGYNACIAEALRDYQTAMDNAKALYIACMKNCGYVIAQE